MWGKRQYIDEALRQLNDAEYYVPLSSNPIDSIKQKLETLVGDAFENKWVTSKERDFLIPQNHRLATLYLLPKVPKNLNFPLGRPIICSIETISIQTY